MHNDRRRRRLKSSKASLSLDRLSSPRLPTRTDHSHNNFRVYHLPLLLIQSPELQRARDGHEHNRADAPLQIDTCQDETQHRDRPTEIGKKKKRARNRSARNKRHPTTHTHTHPSHFAAALDFCQRLREGVRARHFRRPFSLRSPDPFIRALTL